MRIDVRQLENRDHFVVPVIMIVEGVHTGSQGGLFYPADELEKTVLLWNGKPVVVYHPDMYSSGFAGAPEIFSQQKIGNIFNSKFEDKQLKAQAWIDCERVAEVDKRVLNAIQTQQMMEISTGVLTDHDQSSGTYNGKTYNVIARNYVPDHLAILPDKIGACSIEDGCGLLRNEGKEGEEILVMPQMEF